MKLLLSLSAAVSVVLTWSALAAEPPAFRLEQSVVLTSPTELHWSQSRAALIPANPPRVILTTQEIEKAGAHGYRDLFMVETTDGARTWSAPQRIESLRRARMPEGHDFVMGDVCPQWHAATGVVLATGKTFGFRGGVKEDRGLERVSYAVFSPATNQWSGLQLLALPEQDHAGIRILEANAGCNQRFDLPGGEILLPIRYRRDPKTRQYTTIVARCTFDGTKLTYLAHGSELTIPRERGLYEPSVIGYGGRYFLTMRADHSAYVARSRDGLNYEPIVEWTYDDGQVLGSYNTQQHWIAHSGGLYLTYTRRGAGNDHVFRHRAPLFIARVDPERLCVLRATEQVLMPETGLDLGGGFASVDVSAQETWVISSEMAFPKERIAEPNRVRLTKILWNEPNKLFPAVKAQTSTNAYALPSAEEPKLPELSFAKAAESLDRISLAWVRKHECGSCHTGWPYLMARGSLDGPKSPALEEIRKFFEGRIVRWDEDEKIKKHSPREIVGTAAALALHDARSTGKLQPITREALDRMWTLQRKDGTWSWPKCDWPPFEIDDYYGAVLAAVGVAFAPDDYARGDSARAGVEKLRAYFQKAPAPSLHHQTWLLWASAKLDGLLTAEQQQTTIAELLALQRSDGGWSMEALGKGWVGRKGEEANPDAASDGYGTGLVVYVLRQAGVPASHASVQRGKTWLASNQRESGRWFTRSLNGVKQHYISDAASAFAVLALDACE